MNIERKPAEEVFRTSDELRCAIKNMLGIPAEVCSLASEFRGSCEHNGIIIEKWVWSSERGSRVPSLLYRPKDLTGRLPGMVIANGHGDSKNTSYAQYTGQLYAKLGIVCLLHDTIGEEERQLNGEMGTRDHDDKLADQRAAAADRCIMGKMVLDAWRAVDFLCSHEHVDPDKVGVAGYSLGGTIVSWLMALEPRLKLAIVAGWGFSDLSIRYGKLCSSVPDRRIREICSWPEFIALAAPHCAVMVMNGRKDVVIDREGTGDFWRDTETNMNVCAKIYEQKGEPDKIKVWYDVEGGHRAYYLHKDALLWIHDFLGTPGWSREQIQALPILTLEQWFAKHGLEFEKRGKSLYWNQLHAAGSIYADLDIVPLSAERLKCLYPEEKGSSPFTLEGWLDRIENTRGKHHV